MEENYPIEALAASFAYKLITKYDYYEKADVLFKHIHPVADS